MHSFDEFVLDISQRRGKKSSGNLELALASFDLPNTQFSAIHVAGTNGKGSTSCKIAAGLTRAGYKVGLFTSPHIRTFCERIQIDGQEISEEKAMAIADRVAPFELSFFETVFVIACLYFVEQGIDYGVIEAGIGGLFDTTNCLSGSVSVVTSIGYDHKELLGNTLEDIATHKAGIIKPGHTAFIGASADYPCMYSEKWTTYCMPEAATYIAANNQLAEAVLRHLGVQHPDIEAINLPCRLEKHGDWIFDIAHNPPAVASLLAVLPQGGTFYIGFSVGKEYEECIHLIAQVAEKVVLIPPAHSTLVPQEVLKGVIEDLNIACSAPETLEALLQESTTNAVPHVVCGSAFVMEPLRSLVRSSDKTQGLSYVS